MRDNGTRQVLIHSLTRRAKRAKIKRDETFPYTLYKNICFSLPLTLHDFGCCFYHIIRRYFLLHSAMSTEERRERTVYIPLWFEGWNAWSNERCSSNCIGARSIVRSFCLSCNQLALFYNTLFHCTKDAYRRKIYHRIQCIYIAQRSHWIVRVSYKYFFICIILTTVYKPYLIFLIAQIFCRFVQRMQKLSHMLHGVPHSLQAF